MIVSQTRDSVFALHFEQWMCHRPSRPPRNTREIFLWKICKCRKYYLLWIFSILMCVRYMFSDNFVNFKLKIAFQFHPQMKFGFSCINSSISTIFNLSKKMTSFIKLCDFCCSYVGFWNFWLQAYCYSLWPNRFGCFESNDSNHFSKRRRAGEWVILSNVTKFAF